MTVRPEPALQIVRPSAKQPSCAKCAEQAKQLKEMRATIRELTAQNERLVQAIQREAHFIDQRAPHDGKNYIKRNR